MNRLRLLILMMIATHTMMAQELIPEITVDDRIIHIRELNRQLDSVNSIPNQQAAMKLMMELIEYRVKHFGEDANSYQDLIALERLINEQGPQGVSDSVYLQFNIRMGWVLEGQSKYEEALPYLKEAVRASEQRQQPEFLNTSKANLAIVLGRLNRFDEASSILDQLESDFSTAGDIKLLSYLYEKKYHYYLNQNKLDSALSFIKKSIDKGLPAETLTSRYSSVAYALLVIGQGKGIDSVIYYAEKGLQLAKSADSDRAKWSAYNILKFAYAISGNYEKAYTNYNEFYQLEQQQFSFSNAIRIGDLNAEREKERANLQQQLANEKLSNQRMVIIVVAVSALLLLALLIYIANRLKLIRRQKEEITIAKAKAEQSEQYKERFLANMSHEIRTPMNAINGMVSALKRRKHSKEEAKFLNAMQVSTDNLLVILNDVLDMSKIESGTLEIQQVPIQPRAIIGHVIELLQFKAQEKGLEIKAEIDSGIPEIVLGDPARLNQILVNLVGNAIKFTSEGQISVSLEVVNDKLRYIVKDTGTGIAAAQLETIFDAFQQGQYRKSGTGLGLTICKQLTELQAGKIWIESEEGQGSAFYVELPLLRVTDEIKPDIIGLTDEQLKAKGKELTGLRILIAEDAEFNVMVVKDDLEWFIPEVQLKIVSDGRQAVEAYQQHEFDIILMDVQMPEMNGYEATRTIREIESSQSKHIPIIAMTASLLNHEINNCYTAGMDAYIPKPYQAEELINPIYNLFRN